MPFLWGPDNDGHLFWECPHPPFVHIRESPEFRDLLLRDRSSWPRCLLWHGWLPALACAGEVSPCAATDDDVAFARLERVLGSYSENAWKNNIHIDKCLVRADTIRDTEAFIVTAGVLKTLPLYAMRADSPERHVPSVLASGLR